MNYFFIVIAIIFMVYIFNMIKKKEFSIKESIFWVLGTFAILIFAVFPIVLDKIAIKLNVNYPPSLLFLVGIMFLLLINFRNTKKICKQTEKITELAQRCAILEFEVEKIKTNKNEGKNNETK